MSDYSLELKVSAALRQLKLLLAKHRLKSVLLSQRKLSRGFPFQQSCCADEFRIKRVKMCHVTEYSIFDCAKRGWRKGS